MAPDPARWLKDRNTVFCTLDYPAVDVNWYDAMGYFQWLNTQTITERAKLGLGAVRFPTEGEWEHAAKGPDGTFKFGTRDGTLKLARFDATSTGPVKEYPGVLWRTTPGSGLLEGAELFGMAGNVWQWVADWYGAYLLNAGEEPIINPLGPLEGHERVMRGGSWGFDDPASLAAAFRFYGRPGRRSGYAGFRGAVAPRDSRNGVKSFSSRSSGFYGNRKRA